jgi:nitrite reductase/ring-hydroxylating ferredoxin subunit
MSLEETPCWHELPHAPAASSRLADLTELPDGGAHFLGFGPDAAPFRLVLLRSGEKVYGYVNRCAHFGVPLTAKKEHLILKPHESISCNVHYARFRWQDGFCVSGDCAGESLIAVPVVVRDGVVYVAD